MPKNKGEKNKLKKALRKIGYLKDQKGILNRYFRESTGWESHLKNTREFILQSAAGKEKGKAVIMGSGWLLDVPIDELSKKFNKVTLLDIRHPPQVRKKTEHYSNIELIEADLTGGMIKQTYESIKAFRKNKTRPLITGFKPEKINLPGNPDFVVSCNTLTQLNTLIKEYLKKYVAFSNQELLRLEEKIQTTHLKILETGKSCLITEYEEEVLDENNNLVGANPLIKTHLPEGNFQQKWKWYFDSKMYYREDAKTYMNVVALDI